MESRDYQEGFEDFLQEKADQYKLYPSERVWNAINTKLHPRPKWSYLVMAAIFIGLGIGGKVYDSSIIKEPQAFSENDIQNSFGSIQEAVNSPQARVVPISRNTLSADVETPGQPSVVTDLLNRSNGISSNLAGFEPAVNYASAIPASSLAMGVETRVISMFDAELEIAAGETGTDLVEKQRPAESETGNQILDEAVIHEPIVDEVFQAKSMATVENATKKELSVAKIPAPEKANAIKVLKPRHLRIGWQLYASPTVSYRKLSGHGMSYYNNSSMSSVFTADVEKSVRHKPAVGFELGTALTYATGPKFRFKTGVQLNINRYDIEAFSYVPEVAPLTRGGIGHTTINAISTYRNHNGFSKTWLKNQHIMMSLPLGAEITLFGNEKIKFNIGGTLQPTFVLNNQAYMISTNMKNYAKEPSLYKNFNIAAGAEAYLSIKSGSIRWMVGPQFRYQVFSSYKKEYPINEHLTDYGFKIGISR